MILPDESKKEQIFKNPKVEMIEKIVKDHNLSRSTLRLLTILTFLLIIWALFTDAHVLAYLVIVDDTWVTNNPVKSWFMVILIICIINSTIEYFATHLERIIVQRKVKKLLSTPASEEEVKQAYDNMNKNIQDLLNNKESGP